jgi:ABC-type nitrate/sulfonate/bicarbonate transport system permease component
MASIRTVAAALDRREADGLAAFLRRPAAARTGVVVLALVLWELAAHTVLDPDFMSPPTAIAVALPGILGDAKIVQAILVSFYELVVAFALSVAAGVLIGAPIGLHKFTLRSALPLVLLIYSIPQVTILPLFVMYFGIGPAAKIAFGVSHGIFPIILNVVAGAQTIEAAHLTAARSMGANRRQIFRRVVLPHMVPSLFTGLRLGMSATLLGVLLAELYVSTGGIGYYTQLFSNSFQPSSMFALVAVLAVMAAFLNEVVRRAETRASFWRVDRQ